MIFVESSSDSLLDAIAAGSTAAAALFAAYSAWVARKGVKAATAAVEEARQTRSSMVAPRLVLEKDFLHLLFQWPHVDGVNGGPVFLARKDWAHEPNERPAFVLQNFGQSPALEVVIVFELDDPYGELEVPPELQPLGLSIGHAPPPPGQTELKQLSYKQRDGSSYGLPLYRKWTERLPSCVPGQARTVEFPFHLLNRLFLRALQQGSHMRKCEPYHDVMLSVRVSCTAVDNTPYSQDFRWKFTPYHHGEVNPVKAWAHCTEVAVFPEPEGVGVA